MAVDRAHVADMLAVGLIDKPVRDALPPVLQERLAQIQRDLDEDL